MQRRILTTVWWLLTPVPLGTARCIEEIGTYDPLANPATINVDVEKAQTWIKNGAQPTDTVRGLLKKAGVL